MAMRKLSGLTESSALLHHKELTMKSIPPRPSRSSVELAAIREYLSKKNLQWDAETIASCSTYDGFQLMQELQQSALWDFDREDLDTLDGVTYAIDRALKAEEEKWAKEHDVYSKTLPAGTPITIGVIDGVYEHGPARYLVTTPECTPSAHRIIKFEEAIPL